MPLWPSYKASPENKEVIAPSTSPSITEIAGRGLTKGIITLRNVRDLIKEIINII
jgi:hypothetical protein